ncbi:MAG TPA: CotH kinase family protein [Oscillatoriaceae cyanobacterium]
MKTRFGALTFAALLTACQPHAAQTPAALDWAPFGPIAEGATAPLHLNVQLLAKPGGPTLKTVDNQTDWLDGSKKVRIAAIVRGDGLDATAPNAVFAIRGHSTRLAKQKSYGLKLKKHARWRGVRQINLNKCPYDLTRMRDKLTFDLLAGLPELPSLDTHFVALTLNGQDAGLFTQLEEPDKRYLKAHKLDPHGNLYKAERFDFNREPEVFKNSTDAGYDKVRFERELAIHGSKDHAALIAMLGDVNNPDTPIDQVIDQDFDRRNYVSWLAVNILLQNLDTNEQNFYLYRAKDSPHWRFLPWDYDGAWGWYDQPGAMAKTDPNYPARWQRAGVANWWGVPLHRRFLENPADLAELTARVDTLATKFFTRERLAALIDSYTPAVQAELAHAPDLGGLPATGDAIAAWKHEVARLYTIVPQQQKRYHETLSWPMPFFLGQLQSLGNNRTFSWDASYSLVGDSISYDFALSRTPRFARADLILEKDGLTGTSLSLTTSLTSGDTYYWRVIARDATDPTHKWEIAFDKLSEDGQAYPGVGEFSVP